MNISPTQSENFQWLKCKTIVDGREYSIEAINNRLLDNKPLFNKIIQSLSDDCYSNLAKNIRHRVETLNDSLALNVWCEMLRTRDEEFLCDHSLHMFVMNTSLVTGFLISSSDNSLFESIGIGFNFYAFDRREHGYQKYDDRFDGKILISGIYGLPDRYYFRSTNAEEAWLDVERYLKDEMDSGGFASLEVKKIQQLLISFEYARSKPFNETIPRAVSSQDSTLTEKFGDFDGDGRIDRLVIAGATNEQSGDFRTDPFNQPPRKLYIYRDTGNGSELLLENDFAIPPLYCDIVGSSETRLQNIQFSKGLFSFVYTNGTHFSYEYIFTLKGGRRGLFLDKIVVQYLEDIRGTTLAANKEITSESFGERSLEKFNYFELNVLHYLNRD